MIIEAIISALIGVWALSIVVVRYYKKPVNVFWLAVLTAGALMLMINDVMLNIIGLVMAASFYVLNTSLFKGKGKEAVAPREAP